MDRFSRVLFFVSLVTLSVVYGSFGAIYGWFPHKQIRQSLGAWLEFRENWRNDLELEPTRHLVPALRAGGEAFVMHDAAAAMAGQVLVAGLAPAGETLQGATLFGADGAELHRWHFDYEALDPEGPGEFNVMVHGVEPLPDGSLVVAFDAGKALARIDACGVPMWVENDSYHHSVERAEDGTLWTWRAESIVNLDADTGEEISAFDFREDVVVAQELYGALGIRTLEKLPPEAGGFKWFDDPFHANDVEPLDTETAAAFPGFEAGDLLISLRELNLVGVIDPSTRRFRWFEYGPWFKQHDPDFQPDGRITVYDNRMGLDVSRIVAVDPASGETEVVFEDSPETPFYSWRRGKHQVLDNGNLLITESERGRVFEVTAEGRLVWERRVPFDEERNAIVTSAELLPTDFFDSGAFDCSSPAAAAAGPETVAGRTGEGRDGAVPGRAANGTGAPPAAEATTTGAEPDT